MRKINELTNISSCLQRARNGEMVFVLLARDPAAPVAIMKWCEERVRLGKNVITDSQIMEAVHCADVMENERTGRWIEPVIEVSDTNSYRGVPNYRGFYPDLGE